MARTRKMTISTTIDEEEVKARLLEEHLLDLGLIQEPGETPPEGMTTHVERRRGRAGGYTIRVTQDRVPRRDLPLLGPAEEASPGRMRGDV